MSRTGVGVRVFIDDRELDDGCINWTNTARADLLPEGLFAMENLQVTWGRNSTMGQPQSSSLSLTIMDAWQSQYFNEFGIGSDIKVVATAMISGNATIPAFIDPDFENEFRYTALSAVGALSTAHVETGTQAAFLTPVDGAYAWRAELPPAEVQPAGGDPSAWAEIPALAPGQTWRLNLRMWVPRGVNVQVNPILYSGPYSNAWTALPAVGWAFGEGGWTTVDGTVAPGASAGWLGVQLVVSGAGASWADADPATSWRDALEPVATGDNLAVNPFQAADLPGMTSNNPTFYTARQGVTLPTATPDGITTGGSLTSNAANNSDFAGSASNLDGLGGTGPARYAGAWVYTTQANARAQWFPASDWEDIPSNQWVWFTSPQPVDENVYLSLYVATRSGATATVGAQTYVTGITMWAAQTHFAPPEKPVLPTVPTWADNSAVWIDRVSLLAPDEGVELSLLVFGGRITDIESAYAGGWAKIDITAADFLADLANRYIGSEPWPEETLQNRVLRITDLARNEGEPSIAVQISPSISEKMMTWEDVDHKASAGLLSDVATSVDGILWSATHILAGPYVKLEDPDNRPPLNVLNYNGDYIEVIPIDPETMPEEDRPLDVSACDVSRDPVKFVLDVSDIATRTGITWREQTLDEEGNVKPTDRTLVVIDPVKERSYGSRNVSVQTLLTTREDAREVADRILARAVGIWRIDGLEISDSAIAVPDAHSAEVLLNILDGVRRGGTPLRVTALPLWSPLGSTALVYVEGGTYTYVNGGWECSLNVSRSVGVGRGVTWDALPNDDAWNWDNFDAAMTWEDLRGVAGPNYRR